MNISIVKVGYDVSSVVVDVAAATVVEWAAGCNSSHCYVVTHCGSSYYCYVVIPRNSSYYCYVVIPRNSLYCYVVSPRN